MDADALKLIKWAFSNKNDLQLEVKKITDTSLMLNDAHDYKINLIYNKIPCVGRGIDRNEERALTKAIAEALERAIMKSQAKIHGIRSSNGIAAHTDLESAQKHAYYELLERDLFLLHYFTKTPFQPLPSGHLADNLTPYGMDFLEQNSVELKLYLTAKTQDDQNTVVALATGLKANPKFGIILGISLKDDLPTAVSKAISECMMNVPYYVRNPADATPLDLSAINLLSKCGAHEQLLWALNPESVAGVNGWIDNSTTDYSLPFLNSHKAACEYKILFEPRNSNGPPIYVVQCVNNKLQNMSFGKTDSNDINMTRLREFKSCDIVCLNFVPHPIG